MQKTLAGENSSEPENGPEICDKLASYYLFEKESRHRDVARAILKKASAASPSVIFTFLTKFLV